jgi:hypothetical protein
VQQRRAHGRIVGAGLRSDGGDGQRMADIRIPAVALLALVPVRGNLIRAPDQPGVGARPGLGDDAQ